MASTNYSRCFRRIADYYESLMYDINYETERLIGQIALKDDQKRAELNSNRRAMIDKILKAEDQSLGKLDPDRLGEDEEKPDDELFKAAYRVRVDRDHVELVEVDKIAQNIDEQTARNQRRLLSSFVNNHTPYEATFKPSDKNGIPNFMSNLKLMDKNSADWKYPISDEYKKTVIDFVTNL